MKKKLTIIGGSGFVGTNLCKQLQLKGYDFEIIDLKMSKDFYQKCKIGDVRDLQSLRRTISGSIVVNLAAMHRDDLSDNNEYFLTNVKGAQNVAEICSEKGIEKIIFTSTVAVYGFSNSETDENGNIEPFNEYGQTKFDAEEKLRSWQKEGRNSLIIVRPTVIFGEGNRGNVFNLLNQIASGKFIMVGEGKNIKSMAYIENIAAFLESCIRSHKRYSVYNYVDKPDMTMNELVSLVRFRLRGKQNVGLRIPYWLGITLGYIFDFFSYILNRKFLISVIRVKKFILSTQFKSNISSLNDFVPPFSLEEGIERTLRYEFIKPRSNRKVFYTE